MFGARTLPQPRVQAPVNLALVSVWVAATEVLPHHPHADVKEIERLSECAIRSRRRHSSF